MKPNTPQPRRDSLNLRISAAERNLIDRAAASTGETRTDFIAEFLARMDAPAQPNERLRKTMKDPSPLEPMTLMATVTDLRAALIAG